MSFPSVTPHTGSEPVRVVITLIPAMEVFRVSWCALRSKLLQFDDFLEEFNKDFFASFFDPIVVRFSQLRAVRSSQFAIGCGKICTAAAASVLAASQTSQGECRYHKIEFSRGCVVGRCKETTWQWRHRQLHASTEQPLHQEQQISSAMATSDLPHGGHGGDWSGAGSNDSVPRTGRQSTSASGQGQTHGGVAGDARQRMDNANVTAVCGGQSPAEGVERAQDFTLRPSSRRRCRGRSRPSNRSVTR